MAIVFSRLLVYLAFFPTFSRTKYRHFWHGNQGNPITVHREEVFERIAQEEREAAMPKRLGQRSRKA